METKICKKCFIEKELTNFTKCKQNKDGLYSYCKNCSNQIRETFEPIETKMCPDCNVEKEAKDFPPSKRNKDGLHSYCRKCNNARTAKSPNYREHVRKGALKRLYKISPADYEMMFEAQNGVCGICFQPETEKREYLCVDHNHETGKVRGLLCHDCNLGLGKFKDNKERLFRAISYLDLTS